MQASWKLVVDEEVLIISTCTHSSIGLAILFSAFYNLNLEYQSEASATLEFMQW